MAGQQLPPHIPAGDGSPGSHGRNWRPAETMAEYEANCRAGLERYSERRAAELLGWSRIRLYRARLMAELPDDLFDRLLADGVSSSRELAAVARGLRGEAGACESERCPHCGVLLRLRGPWRPSTARLVNDWIASR